MKLKTSKVSIQQVWHFSGNGNMSSFFRRVVAAYKSYQIHYILSIFEVEITFEKIHPTVLNVNASLCALLVEVDFLNRTIV